MSRDRTGSRLKPILAGSGLDPTAIFLKIGGQDWIGLRKYLLLSCDYFENIKNVSCDAISQVCVYFATKCKNSARTILQFELHPPLFTYDVEL